MKFTIDRDRWRCGMDGTHASGHGGTCLLNEEGYQCCLGFVAQQLGYTERHVKHVEEPCDLAFACNDEDTTLITEDGLNSDLSKSAMEINDNETLHPADRERNLVCLFRTHGHEVEFTGEYQDKEEVSGDVL